MEPQPPPILEYAQPQERQRTPADDVLLCLLAGAVLFVCGIANPFAPLFAIFGIPTLATGAFAGISASFLPGSPLRLRIRLFFYGALCLIVLWLCLRRLH